MVIELLKIDKKRYASCVSKEQDVPVMYGRMEKNLYNIVDAALNWFKELTHHFKSRGFEINPYNFCIANKMIDGKLFTVLLWVDDLMMSYLHSRIMDTEIAALKKKYGQV